MIWNDFVFSSRTPFDEKGECLEDTRLLSHLRSLSAFREERNPHDEPQLCSLLQWTIRLDKRKMPFEREFSANDSVWIGERFLRSIVAGRQKLKNSLLMILNYLKCEPFWGSILNRKKNIIVGAGLMRRPLFIKTILIKQFRWATFKK